jgi:hypothetical protein
VSSTPSAPQEAFHEVLRQEWQNLAEEILFQDPEGICPHLRALLLHALRRVDEYTCLVENGSPVM